jgi:type II secretory pathway component GspD/PulD (secretin)
MIFTKPAGYRLYIVPGQLMRVMKITFILITTVLLQVTAATKAQVTLNEKNTPLKKVIKSLKRQSGYDFFYNDSDLRNAKPVTIRINNVSLEDALAACFKEQDLTYTIEEKTVVIKEKEPPASSRSIPARSSRQQTGRIGGKVLDEKGESLPGAAIKIVENRKVVSSAVDGSYVIVAEAGLYTIEVSFVGYTTQRISGVTVREGQLTALDIALKPASARLNEVVITSTYSQASVEGLYARQ